jgi:hypothetical protein
MVSPGTRRHQGEKKVCARNSKGKTMRRKRATVPYKMEMITTHLNNHLILYIFTPE